MLLRDPKREVFGRAGQGLRESPNQILAGTGAVIVENRATGQLGLVEAIPNRRLCGKAQLDPQPRRAAEGRSG